MVTLNSPERGEIYLYLYLIWYAKKGEAPSSSVGTALDSDAEIEIRGSKPAPHTW